MATGKSFHKFTMRLKNENFKTSVLKRRLESSASEFLMLYLVHLKLAYDWTSKVNMSIKTFDLKKIENTSLKVLAYGIYARVVDVSEIDEWAQRTSKISDTKTTSA